MFIQVMEKFNRFPNTCNNKNNWIQNRQVHTVQLLLACCYVDYQNHVTGANVTRWYVNEMVVQKRFASYIQIPGKTDGRDKPRYLRKSETKS